MPQATWLRPYVFLIHINDLQAPQTTFKPIHYVTIIEIQEQSANSHVQTAVDSHVKWSANNHMRMNIFKMKEMRINFPKEPTSPTTPAISTDNCNNERVSHLGLFGIKLTNDLRWGCHIQLICHKANKHLHFSKLFK